MLVRLGTSVVKVLVRFNCPDTCSIRVCFDTFSFCLSSYAWFTTVIHSVRAVHTLTAAIVSTSCSVAIVVRKRSELPL